LTEIANGTIGVVAMKILDPIDTRGGGNAINLEYPPAMILFKDYGGAMARSENIVGPDRIIRE